jgi:hypothetical protein
LLIIVVTLGESKSHFVPEQELREAVTRAKELNISDKVQFFINDIFLGFN